MGTLCIYTLLEKGSSKFKNGQSRMASRLLADCIQSEVTATLQRDYDSLWRRRQLWDRSYSECRTTDVPGIIFELLSHQNFADMKYGQDPQFRFDASRSVYKGIVKFLSTYYGTSYVIQPLPVTDFAAEFEGDKRIRLRWRAVSDSHEPTAEPDSYLVYTRVDGGAWGDGLKVKECSLSLPIEEGHIYSYKVVAVNDGGCSFPSEILSVGVPPASKGKVLIINNFNRISGPSFFDTPDYAGFDDKLDSGVPWGSELSFIGENYENRRGIAYAGNNAPGFGASDYYFAGRSYMGNTFDYPYLHGRALFDLGYSFCSASSSSTSSSSSSSSSSAAAASASTTSGTAYYAIDVICGKQVSTIVGTGQSRVKYKVFPKPLRDFLKSASQAGTHLIVSGANIATDGWDSVYPIKDSCFTAYQQEARYFISNTLGYKWISSRASRDGI
ncbi:MAG TPA: N-acetylmuramoyl-L-alanine amidase, partial [Candidatus Cryptobacteroides sp.]|nr:N-acetylmuramoyl-L-alanine amidase [Candidatus Cryptobacteroides sp.]